MTRAAILARVSSAEQADPSKASLDQQIESCERLAHASGWEVVRIFREEGVSGAVTLEDRPEVTRLLAAARSRQFGVLLVHKFDRFTRSARLGLDLLHQLEDKHGIQVVSVTENIDGTTPQGRMFRNQLLSFAEYEREMIRDRVIRGRHGKAEKGLVPGGAVPFGYMLVDGHIVENPEEGPTIRLIFDLAVAGGSTYEIARELERRGIQSRKGSSFQHSNIRNWLKSPIYKGAGTTHRVEKVIYPIEAPALVDEATWNEAQAVIGRTANPQGRRKKHSYALSGRVFHDHADGSRWLLYGMKRTYRLHRCNAALNQNLANPKGPPCPGLAGRGERTSVRASQLEAYALTEMLRIIGNPAIWAEYREAADRRAVAAKEAEQTADAAHRILADLDQEAGRLVKLYQKGRIDEATFDRESEDLDRRRVETQVVLDHHVSNREAAVAVGVTIEDLLAMEIRPPVAEHLADLDDIGTEQVVTWLHNEARHMRQGRESSPEAIIWLKSLIDRFDAAVVLDPTGAPRLELGAVLRAAA